MKKNFDIRLAALREYLKLLSADETVFIAIEAGRLDWPDLEGDEPNERY